MKNSKGKPSVISKEKIDKLFQEISRGVPIKYACTLAGIGRSTYYGWLDIAKELPDDLPEDDEKYIYKYLEKKKEEGMAMAVATRVEHIRTDNSWQSSAWWLERVDHEHFGRKSTIDANVDAKIKSEDISKLFDNEKVSKILDEEKD